jgi:hypothetical protein
MTGEIGKLEAHHSFATKVKPDQNENMSLSRSRSSFRALRSAGRKSTSSVNLISDAHDASNLIDHSVLGPEMILEQYRDSASKIRSKRRQNLISNAHKSLARHGISAARKSYHTELFQDQLRINHATGKYEEVNCADLNIPIAGVGIAVEQLLIPSLLLPQAEIHELRVSYVDPNGAAGLSNRVKVGDILLKACTSLNVSIDFLVILF